MKTSIKLVMALCVMGLVMTSCAKRVVLNVDTELLSSMNPDNLNLESACKFKGQKDDVTLKKFLVTVNKGRVIKWKGRSLNKKDKVNIEAIIYEGGTNPFPNRIESIDYIGRWKGKMKRVVKAKMVRVTDENLKYVLRFSVKKGNDVRTYDIDPEARVMQ